MNTVIRSIVPVAILGVCLLAMPVETMAGKPDKPGKSGKGGTPNPNSVPTTAACLIDSGTARVCSSKGISNVVLWCGGTWVKHENFGPGEVYDATVGCFNDQGDRVGGAITMVAIKSGSPKHVKHHPSDSDYDPAKYNDGGEAPSGSGLFTRPASCPADFSCATLGDDPVVYGDDTPPGDDVPVDDTPPPAGDVPVDDPPPGDDVPVDDDPPGVPIGDDPPNQEPPVYF